MCLNRSISESVNTNRLSQKVLDSSQNKAVGLHKGVATTGFIKEETE